MALTARSRYLASILQDVFDVQQTESFEPFTNPKFKDKFEAWIKGVGPSRLFIYYQHTYKITESGEIQEYPGQTEFSVSDGENVKLLGKGVYFLRVHPKPINTSIASDDTVLFGEISKNSVNSLNVIVNNVFKPLVEDLKAEDWGDCEDEQRKEFLQVFDKFANELREAIRSLMSSITLDKYDEKYENEAKNVHNAKTINAEMITNFEKIFNEWSDKIEATLEETEAERKDEKDSGPRVELDYWKQRMRKLTGISEQLHSKNCRTVYDVLDCASKPTGDRGAAPRDKLHLATSKWRNINLRVTEALNEAKDNVKYLQTLEKFIEPLYEGNPVTIKESLPALMNSIKMIHTIARYYNTNERMTGLFIKITNEMIYNCKKNILYYRQIQAGKTINIKKSQQLQDDALWDGELYPRAELIAVLNSCLELHDAYVAQYKFTKERLQGVPKAKQFDFSPNQIFGKFELFCRRVKKLIDLFGTIQQFKTLEKHNLENIEPILKKFDHIVLQFKKMNHKLLDYNQNLFDRDFVEFNVAVSSVETELQHYIDDQFQQTKNIEKALKLLRKFKSILHRENLKAGLNSKYNSVFINYESELQSIQDQYNKYKSNPPIVRNLPIVSGSITWSRHLFYRISVPMEQFPPELIKAPGQKAKVKHYNNIGYTLFMYEFLWRQKWTHEVEKAKAGLQATLIIRHPENNKLYVNFDSEILTLIREAKCLSRIGIDIPESAKIVLLQEDKFKMYNNELMFVLKEYDRIVNKIRPNTKSLLVPHLEDLEYKLRPGMVTLTWTSMNIDGYLHHVHQGLAKLEQLIININDIMENRIENNLKTLSKTVLVDLPQDSHTYTLEEFVEMQENWISIESKKLISKNQEVEGAVEDLIQTICSYQLDQHVEAISAEEIQKLSKYYNWSMYQALLHATKYSLNQMKERICGRGNRGSSKQVTTKPFFEVDVNLEGHTCILKPTLDEVQTAINMAASHVLKSTKKVQNWNQKDQPEDEREPFYTWIAKDKEIVKVILLLTGSIQGTKNYVYKFLESFEKFNWLWKQKPANELKNFNKNNPQLEDYEEKLRSFEDFIKEIDSVASTHVIGALSLKTENVKSGLKRLVEVWKDAFSKDLHIKAKNKLEELTDEIKQIQLKIGKKVVDIDSLGSVMSALEEIRQKQSEIDLQFKPVTDMYNLLESWFADIMDKEEMDQKVALQKDWSALVSQSEQLRNELQGQQAEFKKQLIMNVDSLVVDVDEFRTNFETKGPMDKGITPREALDRLKQFSDEYSVKKRKFDSYEAGETLFGLPHQSYPKLVETDKEIQLLDKLYNLYSKVKETIGRWNEVPWADIDGEIAKMIEQGETYGRECMRLPGVLKSWDAYTELKKEIDTKSEELPLIEALAKPSIRDRHWDAIIELVRDDGNSDDAEEILPYQSETFNLSQIFGCNILRIKEDIEEITESADKQLKLEDALRNDIKAYWDEAELTVNSWTGVDQPCILGAGIVEIQEKLEEHQMNLNQMNAQRYVTPFKGEVMEQIALLSDVQDILERWVKVQNHWTNLVTVFTTGDISKQMPAESKKFRGINKAWLKIMERANEQKNVIQCCNNDILKSSLGELQSGLEFCQKKLEGYLEQKRSLFPRFYFCSDGDLLKILSVGSDPQAVQDDFEKLFDAINRVSFDEADRRLIVSIHQMFGGDEEAITLVDGVKAEGNIEDWLCRLEQEMQRSVKGVCKSCSQDYQSISALKDFVDQYPSQIALLGIQMLWTSTTQNCLERPAKEKLSELDKKKKEMSQLLADLVEMCLLDIKSKLIRTKIETMVTIHVHQKEVFVRIADDAKQHKIKDSADFEWTKNTRCVWKHEDGGNIAVQVNDVEFIYSYEFLGAKERLCITGLTDRCYLTLTQALGMYYGGAPAGPAGTGKTETVKDLGRTLGIFVVVTNCSDEHRFKDMAKIFKGICQSGLWGCFDEFNRISLPTLSVVAAQVEAITAGKKRNEKLFAFPGEEKPIRLIPACGYFITMNPGYAGRQELPENLKVLFRSVSMMVPDRQVIIKVKLASVGYSGFEPLAKKFNVLYKLCEEQLSKQRHYDFGLRNILAVLRTAGRNKRISIGDQEETIMARTLRDMNLSKFVAQDLLLFKGLITDIFPNQKDLGQTTYKDVEKNCAELIRDKNLNVKREWYTKIIQLYETSLVRHGFMVVGAAGSGKTTIMNILTEALSNCEGEPAYRQTRLNPKSLTGPQMYGMVQGVGGEWIPGVFSEIWKKVNDKKNKAFNWIVCDGPVDAIWIENLNTVLDDNKILTLANAERIPMSDLCKMTFEVENLDNASPATVSRCGIIYVSATDLSWEPLIDTWIRDRQEERRSTDEGTWVNEFVNKYISKPATFVGIKKSLVYAMNSPEVVRITMLLNLLTALLRPLHEAGETLTKQVYEKLFVYAFAWSLGGLFESEERQRFHKEYLEKVNAPLPHISAQRQTVDKETIFDYYVNPVTKEWELWAAEAWIAPKKIVFSQLLIPTSDSTRAEYIMDKIASLPLSRSDKRHEHSQTHSLLVGGAGTAKTSGVLMYASKFDSNERLFKRVNFSFATLPLNFQESIEAELEKKQSKIFVPLGGKQMTVFLDDMAMPERNTWGDQITLEITRQLIDQRGFYFLSKDERGTFKQIQNLKFLGAMMHPGGGRNDVPDRLKRHFFCMNMTAPSQRSIENIYGRILEALFNPKKYSSEVISMRPFLIDATIVLWEQVARKLLPTPTKFHYQFNIRELARVFGGICAVAQKHDYKVIANSSNLKEKIPSNLFLIGLWRHECERTFVDKLINHQDKKVFMDVLNRVTREKFKDQLGFEDEQLMTDYLFADFQRDDVINEYGELEFEAPFVYEACPDIEAIRTKVYAKLDAYNEKYPSKKMSLVIFDDALKHLLRIARVINSPSGNMLLVGVGGSGKQSLTKLASFIAKQVMFQISLTKSYNDNSLKDDVKNLYIEAGPNGRQVTFIMTDAEVRSETFLEAINSLLGTGEIPGLLNKEDREVIPLSCKKVYMDEVGVKGEDPSQTTLWNFFIRRVKDCLHMVLAFSPVGVKFRERAQRFPALFSTCSIDWFLAWPEEALISVSSKALQAFKVDCTSEVKTELEKHMGRVHDLVHQVTLEYFQKLRRHVYVTPKSYLSFIDMYQSLYQSKYDAIDVESQSIVKGLERLAEASAGVEELKVELKQEDIKLKDASDLTEKFLKELEVENRKAQTKADEVAVVTETCEAQRNQIQTERDIANRDLEQAIPFLRRAEAAVDSIKPKDISELKQTKKPHDICRVVMDAVQILFQLPMVQVAPKPFTIAKENVPFIADSFEEHTKATLIGANFLKDLQEFSKHEKDSINEETIELLEPYLTLKAPTGKDIYDAGVAKNANAALEGLCIWAGAMSDYHKQSKIVKPKLRLLELKSVALKEAESKLEAAQAELAEVEALKQALRKKFDIQMEEKQALVERAQRTRKKMDQANRLILSLQDNKLRWIESSNQFTTRKQRLVGDVAKACAFVSYCGPFNSDYRSKLINDAFNRDLVERNIPVHPDLVLTDFLVDHATVGEWNLQKLPTDDLSIQNAIMVTRSTRYPLMIDPQNQAVTWIRHREPSLDELGNIITLNHPDLKRALSMPLENGMPVLIEAIENEVDPMLDPVLERQYILKGRKKLLKLADQEMDFDDKFQLFMTSRLANPHFSPELAAKTTIIDFTVTQGGLEQQLLGLLISKEQKSLEEQLTSLQEEVTLNTKTLAAYEDQLLYKLANVTGSLLDEVDLIDVLANIKVKSREVNEKLRDASEKTIEIQDKRETFRPVAARGAVLYFCIVELTLVNWMYNISLQQFLDLFVGAIDGAARSQVVKDRVENIRGELTRLVYRYINRGIFERDKVTFKLMVALKILIKDGKLTPSDINVFLKAGAGIDDRNNKYSSWMSLKVWLNIVALSKHKFGNDHTFFYKELPERIGRLEKEWKAFFDKNTPEAEGEVIPDYQEKIDADVNIGHFLHLCLIRAVREDRTLLAAQRFIKDTLGDYYAAPVVDKTEEIWAESLPNKPILYLLSAGADPTNSIEEFARKKRQSPTEKVSMGEAQEAPALEKIKAGFQTGKWVVLNNCHLSLEFMAQMEDILNPKGVVIHEDFRLWITCEPHPQFPLGLLQMAIKVTTEPPKGLRAGLYRTFNTQIHPDFLEKVEPYDKWRSLVFTVCFLHSIVQERRKFGPLGFCIPYEFNASDLEASLCFLDKHMTACATQNIPYSWRAMQYMVAEVQYGGRITDDLDRELFSAYSALWVTDAVFQPNYSFNTLIHDFQYQVPDCTEHARFLDYINSMPDKDTPIVFGLNNNADLTFRLKDSQVMLSTMIDTQPKDSGGGSGKSREEEVKDKLEADLIKGLPADFIEIEVDERLKVLKGPKNLNESGKGVPLNVFLSQEIQRFQMILGTVRKTMGDMVLAIEGAIIMTPDIVDSINAVFDFRVPRKWVYDPTGAEISWLTESLAGWLKGLLDRHHQLSNWIFKERPPSYWLTGFFNPQGFLTAMKQEVTRTKKGGNDPWSLDEVEYKCEVMKEVIAGDDGRIENRNIAGKDEGVQIHGLYLEGAAWSREKKLEEAAGKDLFMNFPIIHVSATSKNAAANAPQGMARRGQDAALDKQQYSCPVYKYPRRNDKYIIFRVPLKADSAQGQLSLSKGVSAVVNWKLKGVALLCCKD